MFLNQRLWVLNGPNLNSTGRNDKENLNMLLGQYPVFFSSTTMHENLQGTKENDSTRRKEKAYEKHLQRLRSHLSEAFQEQ